MTTEKSINLTSYDLLKAAAVIIMVIDHVGYYFFPEDLWWRSVGRIGFPVWFFLVGYARGRDFSPKLWIGCALLIAANLIAGIPVFPFNALFTIILIRLCIDPVMKAAGKNAETTLVICAILLALVLPSYALTEYGTQALITAMFGYVIRNRTEIPGFRGHGGLATFFCLFTLANFVGIQQLIFQFSVPQLVTMTIGTILTCLLLYHFRSVDFAKLTRAVPSWVCGTIQLLGRRTLEIYVAHLILFKFLGMLTQPDRFRFFHLAWI